MNRNTHLDHGGARAKLAGAPALVEIRERFGTRVADIVSGCTDTDMMPKPPWRQRKETYLAHPRDASSSVRLVSCSDKLHKARAILSDYCAIGDALWSRLNASREEMLWYYRSLVEAFAAYGGGRLVDELDRTVSELDSLIDTAKTEEPR